MYKMVFVAFTIFVFFYDIHNYHFCMPNSNKSVLENKMDVYLNHTFMLVLFE